MRLFLILGGIGWVLGAIPATIEEFLHPVSPAADPEVITAFGMPMCACAVAGLLVALVIDYRRHNRRRPQ